MENRIKKISINGRMALGVICLERFVKLKELHNNEEVLELLELLWEFTSSNTLDKWEEKIKEYQPCCIEETYKEKKYEDYEFLTKEKIKKYYKLYKESSPDLEEMVESVIEIGCGNLYGGTGEYSKWTLNPTVTVLKIMKRNEIDIPDLKIFERSSFKEKHGWGERRDRLFYEIKQKNWL